ncbi:MAG TPA: hypothetical protein DDX98_11415 [Bacteroidales bacterium]|jgi:hypothetical protein|nr:hypothetical protein [Bacteroidales bacterium]
MKEEALKTIEAQLPAPIKEVIGNTQIEVPKAQAIAMNYAPFMQQINEIAIEVQQLEKGNPEHLEMAKRYRIDLSKICSAAERQKKQDKASLLLEQKFYDALFNVVNSAGRLIQGEAQEIEKYFEKQEAERIQRLHDERLAKVEKYGVNSDHIDLGRMEDDVWVNFYKGTKASYEQKLAAEKKAEEDRKLKERKAKEYAKKLAEENKRLQAEAKRKAEEAEVAQKKALDTSNRLAALFAIGVKKKPEEVSDLSNDQWKELYSNHKTEFNKKQEEIRKAQEKEKQEKRKQLELIEKRVQSRLNELKKLGFDNQGNIHIHMQANFRIFGLQIESMPDNDWNEVIIDFKNKLNLAKERIETERKLEEKRIEDQKRLEAIKKAETEEEERKKQAELAPDKEKIENYLVELLQVKQPKVETEGAKQIITNINKLLLKIEVYVEQKIKEL